MKPKRRMGPQDSPARVALLDAAERVIAQEGHAAVTSRRVAEEAEMKQQLVYYYFESMDALVLETFRRRARRYQDRIRAALESENPWRAYWEASSDGSARLLNEFMSMAHRDEALRAEVARSSAELHHIQTSALTTLLAGRDWAAAGLTPSLMAFLVTSVARNLVTERELGILACPDDLEAFVRWCLARLEPRGRAEA